LYTGYSDDGAKLAEDVLSFGYSRINGNPVFMTVNSDKEFELREFDYPNFNEFPDKTLDNIEYISSSNSIVSLIDTSGKLWIWGENKHGEIGDDFSLPRTFEERYNTLSDVADVSVGLFLHEPYSSPETGYVVAITSNGDVYTWGGNDYGQLGTGDTELRLTPTKIINVK
jgi:alpha-tubulin suppressor-like RCC1 family protein